MRPDHEELALLVHEVRSPVAALAAVAEALGDRTADATARARLVGLALDACAAVERLVRDASVASIALEPVDVVRLARDVCSSAALTGRTPIAVSDPGSPLVVRADPIRLRQALDNLVRNAVAVSAPGEEITIDVSAGSGSVRIAVSDSGPGIAEVERERIFEPGVRLDRSRPGSGLGLAVARTIVEAHGGTLSVESMVGVGSTFTIALPRS